MGWETLGSPGSSTPPSLTVTLADAESRISSQIEKGRQLLKSPINSDRELKTAEAEYSKWNSFNTELLRRIFDSPEVSEEYSAFYGSVILMDPSFSHKVKNYHKDVQDKINRLESIKERLSLYEKPSKPFTTEKQKTTAVGNKVFIVHGRDEGIKQTTARFLEKLGLKPLILHEQPNKGQTIIEKFEDYSSVAYAVVLLTPDDLGKQNPDSSALSPRARQNVVFELGFFLGKLGRERVCSLYKEGIEIPSNYGGVAYIPFDEAGAWKLSLARELKEAGLDIDLNKAI